ncbi:MAG: DUF1223 domain-containing protein [Alphaproteobacteria bacterium]|nr:DUF1223 domain-containing protein [Alphaproteobacteria bacterium]
MTPRSCFVLIALLALFATPARTAERPVVVELFTSQGCYSCPPAEALLTELVVQRRDVLALEFHVDYWDSLVYGGSSWKDPFSDPAFTQRQRHYAQTILGRPSIYTPQMVFDGRREAVGSRRSDVLDVIRRLQRDRASEPKLVVTRDGDDLQVSLDGVPAQPAALWFVTFLRQHRTDVKGGENRGKVLVNTHVVRSLRSLASWSGGPLDVRTEATLESGHDCAVLLQANDQGPILAAARCPAT